MVAKREEFSQRRNNRTRCAILRRRTPFAFLFNFWLVMILTIPCLLTSRGWAEASRPSATEVDGAPGKEEEGGALPGVTPETDEPIFAGGGEFRQYWPLLNLGGPIGLNFTLIYAPDLQFKSPYNDGRTQFPPGENNDAFTTNTIFRVVEFEDRTTAGNLAYINVFLFDDTVVFRYEGTNFLSVGSVKYQMKKVGDYYYMTDPVRERVYLFRSRAADWNMGTQYIKRFGEVVNIIDRNNNTLTFTYNVGNNPTRIEDGLGRRIDLTYNTSHLGGDLIRAADGYGRNINLSFQQMSCKDGTRNVLSTFADVMGQFTRFEYNNPASNKCNLVKRIVRPLNKSYIDQAWTLNPHNVDAISSQEDAYGNETTLSFTEDARENIITTVTHPDGTKRVFHHERERYPLDVTDETDKKFTMSYNADDQITSIKDRLGDTTSLAYHVLSGKPASVTNALGKTITYTYTAQNQSFTNPINSTAVDFTFYNLTRVDYPDGTNEQFTYDAKGNKLTSIDGAGKTWTYTYNSRGQVLTVTNPAGGVITYTYNADATLASSRDSDTEATTYGYDGYRRINRITRPDGEFVQIAYNLNDRITSITDENNHTYSYQYDANGNLIRVTDPAANQALYAYDLMDRMNQATNRLGKISTVAYNNMGRLQSSTDPNGIATSFGYDSRGWPNSFTLGGKTWQTGYNDERIITSTTTPLNHTTSYQSDKLGYLTAISNPLNQITTFTRDPMSRITGIKDPPNRTTTYGYDSRGLLTSVTMPVLGTATYTWNDQGLLSQITDLNNKNWKNWTFGYTNMGRLSSSTDPLNNTWSHNYDSRGRLSQTAYPDTTTLTRTYDDAGNLTRMLYSGGADLYLSYDELNRIIGTNGINLTYDAEGRVIATDNPGAVFGATYDDGGRLKTVTYPSTGSGQVLITVTYTYHATTGLLSRVTDSLTGAQIDFIYDSDRRPTGTTRSNGVNMTLTWDNAGRLTRIQDGPSTGSGFLDLQYMLDVAGQVTQAKMTVPLDPTSFLTPGAETFTYDEASQVNSSGYTYDKRGRLTASPGLAYSWDGASRLTGIGRATLAYNGPGDLITRTEGGKTIRYYYNKAIGLSPIVAEKDEGTGQFIRYYVWTPGGSLLHMIDVADGNKVYFYHFDRTGSTLALTDSTGTVTDKYAYDPYGELLGHQGSNAQPFTFVGQWGVRQEALSAGSGLYHMRARYYDAVTQRFISREPLWPDIANPVSLNPYQYALNNPASYIDPFGLKSESDLKAEIRMAEEFWRYAEWKGVGALLGGLSATSEEEKESYSQQAQYWGDQQRWINDILERLREELAAKERQSSSGTGATLISPETLIGNRESVLKQLFRGIPVPEEDRPKEIDPIFRETDQTRFFRAFLTGEFLTDAFRAAVMKAALLGGVGY